MRRAASRLSLPCRTRSGAHPGVHPSLRVDCRLALPNAALALVIVRSILSGLERRPRRNTSAGWFPTPALELAGVHPLDGMAFFAHRARARNLTSLNWRDVAIPAWLAEAVDGRRPPGPGGAGSLLHSGASQETERGGLGLPPDHARPRRGIGIPGRVSVLVEPCFREIVASGQRGVRLGAYHQYDTFRRVQRPCRCGLSTSCQHRSPRGYRTFLDELGFGMDTRTYG